MDYEGENFMNLLFEMSLKKDAIGNCLSTSVRTNGAVAVFYPELRSDWGTYWWQFLYGVYKYS